MFVNRNILIVLIIGLAQNIVLSQSFFSGKELSVFATYGLSRVQWYNDHIPRYPIGSDQDADGYSPSWSLGLEKNYYLNNFFDFSIGLSYLRVSETHNVPKPGWLQFDGNSQGFIHLKPTFHIKFPDDRFIINLGFRIGFIDQASDRYSSNSFGDMDMDLETGFTIPVLKKWSLRAEWIHGLTRYDYIISMPVESPNYYKYHSFQFGLNYIISNGPKHE